MKKWLQHHVYLLLAILLALPVASLPVGSSTITFAANNGGAGAADSSSVQQMIAGSDITGHWAEQLFTDWYQQGLLKGDGKGQFRPDAPISRGEFATLLNRVFGITKQADVAFVDLKASSPFYSEIKKAVSHGFLQGYADKTVRPQATISRQEAAVVLARAFLLTNLEGQTLQAGAGDLPEWSRQAVSVLLGEGYAQGYSDGSFRPKQVVTRAESLQLIQNIAGVIINHPGTYTLEAGRNALISAPDVTLVHSSLSGNLYVAPGAGGKLDLRNTTVDGTLYVDAQAGGVDLLLQLEQSQVQELRLERTATIVLDNGSRVENLIVAANSVAHISGNGSVSYKDQDTAKRIVRQQPQPTPFVGSGGGNGTVSTPSPTTEPTPTASPSAKPAPEFAEVSVHDPSIVKQDGTYYVFGSHIDAAKSKDLLQWTRFTNGYTTPNNAIFGDLSNNLQGAFAWAGENDADSKGGFSVWAPDVFWNPDYVNEDGSTGAYTLYYSATSTYIRSVLGLAVSNNIEGPYTQVDTLIYSGFTRDEAYDKDSQVNKQWEQTHLSQLVADGKLKDARSGWFNSNGSYNNRLFPNAIDSELFYDAEGKLWMTYGSWSGGIFLLEMDKQTGLPIYPGEDGTTDDGRMIDRYFGIKIAGGYGKSGEGPYIMYDPVSEYYFLFVTYGGLAADGGYNMRLFRAESPSGPYLDASGNPAVLPNNTGNEPFGNKLMGNFQFVSNIGDAGVSTGYVSAGHNSAFYEETTDSYLLFFHSRFPGTGEFHEVRVHSMFLNEDNWLTVAPFRYSGEDQLCTNLTASDVSGDYRAVLHTKDNSKDIRLSQYIVLEPGGAVSGEVTGNWELLEGQYLHINAGEVSYKGVFVRGWDPVEQQYTLTFTALLPQGTYAWGSKMKDLSNEQVVQLVSERLSLGNTDAVVFDLELPVQGTRGTAISWSSSNADVVTTTGVVNRPAAGEAAIEVMLHAVMSRGSATATKDIAVTVLPEVKAELKAHYRFEETLADERQAGVSGIVTGDRINNVGGSLFYENGMDGQAVRLDGKSGIRLPDGLISGSSYSVGMWLKPEVLTPFTTAFFGATNDSRWISLVPQGPVGNQTMLWSTDSNNWNDVTSGMTIQAGEWSHLAFTVENGLASLYINGELKQQLSQFNDVFTTDNALFALGVNWWDTPYQGLIDDLKIFTGALDADDVKRLVIVNDKKVEGIELKVTDKKLSVGSTFQPPAPTAVPSTATNKDLIWHSTNPVVVSVDENGKLTALATGVATITATAADEGGASASYKVAVVEGAIAHFAFEGNLLSTIDLPDQAKQDEGTVTGNRLNEAGGTISYAAGKQEGKQALVLDGESGIRLPNGLIAGSSYTVALSVYTMEQQPAHTTLFFGAAAGNKWLSLLPGGTAAFKELMLWSDNAGKGMFDGVTDTLLPIGQWVDVVFVVDNGKVELFVDGQSRYSGTQFPDLFTKEHAEFAIGVNYWDVPFKGLVDELLIFDKALSAEEIASL